MRKTFLRYSFVLILLCGAVSTATAQEAPDDTPFPYDGGPQAWIDYYENEIQKCEIYLDDLSIGINKATILYDAENKNYPWARVWWSNQILHFELATWETCNRIRILQDAIRKYKDELPPPPSPTPTPDPSPSPSQSPPRTETKTDESTDPLKNEQIVDSNEQIKFIKIYRQELDDLKKGVDRIFRQIDDDVKKHYAGKPVTDFTARAIISSGGLMTVTFSIPEGRLVIYLPDDMRAGDVITGTVVAEPNGKTNEERSQNLTGLYKYQVKVGNETIKQPWGQFTCTWVPQTPNQNPSEGQPKTPGQKTPFIDLAAPIPDGRGIGTIARVQISESISESNVTSEPAASGKIELPNVGQSGRPSQIKGPFTGDARTTLLTIGGQPVTVLAESPRSCLFRSPEQNFGTAEIKVKENNAETTGVYRNLGLRLSAPTTNLKKGERTTVTVTVEGLQGIQQNLPLLLEKRGVVDMAGGDTQTVQIRPADVRADGMFELKRALTGLQAGGFGITATVVNPAHRPIIITLTEGAKVNGYTVRKEGDSSVVFAANVLDPITGDPINGQFRVMYSCSGYWTPFRLDEIELSFKKGAGKQKNPCDTGKKEIDAWYKNWLANQDLGYLWINRSQRGEKISQ